jgi:hypothetical protein
MANIAQNELEASETWSGDTSLLKWLRDAETSTAETTFRTTAMEDYKFYAGRQDSTDVLSKLSSQKRPASVYNEIKPKVDMLIGLAAQTKHSPQISPTNASSEPLAELMSAAMLHFRRKLKAGRKELECFEHTVKSGRSLLHFYINKENPFKPKIEIKRFAGRDFYVDPQSVEYDLSDARFIFLQKWLPEETLKSYWPEVDLTAYQSFVLGNSTDLPTFFNEAKTLYRVMECWYTKYEKVVWFINPISGKDEWLYPDDFKVFAKACKEGIPLPGDQKKQFPVPEIVIGTKKFYWYRIFSGGTVIEEGRSPYKIERFPSILYGAYKDEDTNAWFGSITMQKDPQKAVNTMRRQLSHLLQTLPKGMLAHEVGAILNIEEYEQKSADPSFHLQIAEGKLDRFKFEKQPQISPIYSMFGAECSQSMKDASGVQNEMMGQETSSRTPGVTVHLRQETSLAVLYTLYDNYRESRIAGDEILMSFIQQFISEPVIMRIEGAEAQQLLALNTQLNPEAPGFNDISMAEFELVVDETMETLTQRRMILQTLGEYSHNNPGTIPPDLLLEYADVPYTVKTRIRQSAAAQQEDAQRQADRDYELELLKIQVKADATTTDKIITEKELEIKRDLAERQKMAKAGNA